MDIHGKIILPTLGYGCSSVVECLSAMYEALDLTLRPTKQSKQSKTKQTETPSLYMWIKF